MKPEPSAVERNLARAESFLVLGQRLADPWSRDYVAEAHVSATLALAYAVVELSGKYRRSA